MTLTQFYSFYVRRISGGGECVAIAEPEESVNKLSWWKGKQIGFTSGVCIEFASVCVVNVMLIYLDLERNRLCATTLNRKQRICVFKT